MLKSRAFLWPFAIAALLTPVIASIAWISAGAGHGSYVWFRILLPLSAVFIASSLPGAVFVAGLVEWPIYGLALGWAGYKNRTLPVLAVLALIHAILVVAVFTVLAEDFS